MIANATHIVAIELIAGAQGCDFHAPLRSGARLERVRQALRSRVPSLAEDRYLAPDIAAAAELVDSGTIVVEAGSEILPTLEGPAR